jgi:uncharacterized RDD family membrane protein YckC
MTWQQPGAGAPGGPGAGPDPSLDETRADWPLPDPEPPSPPAPPAAPGPAAPVPPVTPPPASVITPPPVGTWAPPGGYSPGGGYVQGGYPGGGYAPSALQYASTPGRFVAFVVDGFILSAISWALIVVMGAVGLNAYDFSWATSPATLGGDGLLYRTDVAALAIHAALAAAISAAYFILQWSSSARATLGMRLFRLQLGNASDGRTLTRSQAVKRWLALDGWAALIGIVPGLGLLVSMPLLLWELVLLVTVVNSPTKQGLHDRFAESAMVQPPGGSGNGLVVGCLLVAGLLVAIAVVSFIALLFLGAQVSSILSTVGDSI